jgi:hypothetical protein
VNDENFDEEKTEKTYIEKLKDPRWQKLRLRIFERDKWKCLACWVSDKTLHVHHKRYFKDKEPWECPEEFLATLCEECHEAERTLRKEYEKLLLKVMRWHFLSDDLRYFSELLESIGPFKNSDHFMSYLCHPLLDKKESLQQKIDKLIKWEIENGVRSFEG